MVLSLLLLLLVVFVWLWLALRHYPEPSTAQQGEPGDPYANDIAAFRRELHDWDRHV